VLLIGWPCCAFGAAQIACGPRAFALGDAQSGTPGHVTPSKYRADFLLADFDVTVRRRWGGAGSCSTILLNRRYLAQLHAAEWLMLDLSRPTSCSSSNGYRVVIERTDPKPWGLNRRSVSDLSHRYHAVGGRICARFITLYCV